MFLICTVYVVLTRISGSVVYVENEQVPHAHHEKRVWLGERIAYIIDVAWNPCKEAQYGLSSEMAVVLTLISSPVE